MNYIDLYGKPVFATIKQILNRLRLQEDISFSMRETGNDIMINCPFHNDKTPSLGISKKATKTYDGQVIPAGTVNCFGCEYSGDLVTFISDLMGVSTSEAMKWLLNNFESGEYEHRNIDIDFSKEDDNLLQRHIEYKQEFQEYESYCEYMNYRGITKDLAFIYNLQYDYEDNCVIFPVINRSGFIVGYQKRGVESKWMSSSGDVNTLFGMHIIGENNELWLTEGPIDAIITYKHNKDSVAIMGSLSDRKIKHIKDLGYRVLICAFDNDERGDEYAKQIAEEFDDKLVKRVFFPDNINDPGDMPDNFIYRTKYMV